jgi:hypothetical protein
MSDDSDVIMTDADSACTIEGDGPPDDPTPALLRLPLELRERIWHYCLCNGDPVSWPSNDKPPRNITRGVLLLCRALRDETSRALYESNALLFRHPSDANMFLHSHSPRLARLVRRLLVHVAEHDLALWTPYLSSASPHRSLAHDYPRLRELLVVVRCSSPLSGALAGGAPVGITDAYRRWLPNQTLIGLCGALQARTEAGLAVRALYARFATPADEVILGERFAGDFQELPEGPRTRTRYYALLGCRVALDATKENNPWYTGELF